MTDRWRGWLAAALAAVVVSLLLPLATFLVATWLLGWQLQHVLSGSMSPTYPVGSLLVTAQIDASDVRAGMAIVFEDPLNPNNNPWLWLAIVLVILAVGFVVYNMVMKSVKNVIVANTIVMIVYAGVYLFLEYVGHFSGRALYIHAGLIFGTMMALNVWMIIWPYQKKIIAAIKAGAAPDPMMVAQAGLRSRHNTFMSVPLIFMMISNHYPTMYGQQYRDICLLGVILVGFAFTSWLYSKSGKVQGM